MTESNTAASSSDLVTIYRTSVLIKSADEKIRQLLRSGRLQANYYSPRGQEVLAAAMAATLRFGRMTIMSQFIEAFTITWPKECR